MATKTVKKVPKRTKKLRTVKHHPLDDILEPVRRKALADQIVELTKVFKTHVDVAGASYGVKLVATVHVQIET